tara:strand:- start:46345 stop:47109 length:765 start_codon:yes stop_codon:yes gene_type:complete
MAIQKHTAKLINKEIIGNNILELSLKIDPIESSEIFNYIPGQFISIHFNYNEKELKRSYSISNSPNADNIIKFAISKVPEGAATEFLFNIPLNTKLTISGPVGRLVLPDVNSNNHPKRYVLIATGTGVTPYKAMLEQINEISKINNTEFLLLFGARNFSESIYLEDFNNFSNFNSNFNINMFFSRLSEKDIYDSNHYIGYVQNNFDKITPELNPENDIVYLCGNPNMIDETFEILKNKGFTARTVKREKYISSK